MGVRGQKTEGSPCKKCGSTVRYVTKPPRSKEGNCVSCVGDSNEAHHERLKASRLVNH